MTIRIVLLILGFRFYASIGQIKDLELRLTDENEYSFYEGQSIYFYATLHNLSNKRLPYNNFNFNFIPNKVIYNNKEALPFKKNHPFRIIMSYPAGDGIFPWDTSVVNPMEPYFNSNPFSTGILSYFENATLAELLEGEKAKVLTDRSYPFFLKQGKYKIQLKCRPSPGNKEIFTWVDIEVKKDDNINKEYKFKFLNHYKNYLEKKGDYIDSLFLSVYNTTDNVYCNEILELLFINGSKYSPSVYMGMSKKKEFELMDKLLLILPEQKYISRYNHKLLLSNYLHLQSVNKFIVEDRNVREFWDAYLQRLANKHPSISAVILGNFNHPQSNPKLDLKSYTK